MHASTVYAESMETTANMVQDKKQAVSEEDDRSVAELLLDQIEFANVILLNKQDLVPDSNHRKALLAAMKTLNPEAKIKFTTKCKVRYFALVNKACVNVLTPPVHHICTYHVLPT